MIDLQAAREIVSKMSPLPWIVLEEENGQMTIIRNPMHPIHADGLDAWGRREDAERPDARGIAYMRAEFPAALNEIDRLREENKNLQELFSIRGDLQAKNRIAVKEEHERELKAYVDRIEELKEALVEERAIRLSAVTGAKWEDLLEDHVKESEIRPGWEVLATKAFFRQQAAAALGCSPKAWVMTKERRNAVLRAIAALTDPNFHFAPEAREHVKVLKAMLAEAKQ